jgi:hypothetical protein
MRVFRSAVDFSATNRFSRPISGTFIIACSVSVSIPAGDHHPLCGMRRRRHSILLQSSLSNHIGGVIILLFCALAFFAIKRLGYIEFITARKVLRTGGVLRLVRQEIYLPAWNRRPASKACAEECRNVGLTSGLLPAV